MDNLGWKSTKDVVTFESKDRNGGSMSRTLSQNDLVELLSTMNVLLNQQKAKLAGITHVPKESLFFIYVQVFPL